MLSARDRGHLSVDLMKEMQNDIKDILSKLDFLQRIVNDTIPQESHSIDNLCSILRSNTLLIEKACTELELEVSKVFKEPLKKL